MPLYYIAIINVYILSFARSYLPLIYVTKVSNISLFSTYCQPFAHKFLLISLRE